MEAGGAQVAARARNAILLMRRITVSGRPWSFATTPPHNLRTSWPKFLMGEVAMPKGFDLRCGAGKTARVWVQGKRGVLKPGQAMVLLPPNEKEHENSLGGYLAPLRQALIDDNEWHVSVIVCESDYRALKRGIEHLPPGLQ